MPTARAATLCWLAGCLPARSRQAGTSLACGSLRGRCAALLACAALACGSGEQAADLDAAAARGKTVYENVCTACHHRDPRQAGALGPELAGASLELIEAKVLRNEYPPGYAPKRPGVSMPKYEYLAPNLGDMAAYLATVTP